MFFHSECVCVCEGTQKIVLLVGDFWTLEVSVIVSVNFCKLLVLYRILIFPSYSSFPLEFYDPVSVIF